MPASLHSIWRCPSRHAEKTPVGTHPSTLRCVGSPALVLAWLAGVNAQARTRGSVAMFGVFALAAPAVVLLDAWLARIGLFAIVSALACRRDVAQLSTKLQ